MTLKEVAYFLNTFYHTKFHDSSVIHTSEVHAATVGIKTSHCMMYISNFIKICR